MTNTTIQSMLIKGYSAKAFTHNYIFGFTFRGVVYMTFTGSHALPFVTILDKASRGAGFSLRFKPNKDQKQYLLVGAKPLCSVDFFEECVATSKYNRGEIFEKLVAEHFGQEWKKDNVPFTEGPDLTIDGIPYQLKYEKATFTNEKALASL